MSKFTYDTSKVVALDGVAPAESMVTIGFFDGVHVGHQSIIGRVVSQAREKSIRSVAVTFDRHPAEVLRPDRPVRYLMSLERRLETLLAQGLDLILLLPFTEQLSVQPADQFAPAVFWEALQSQKVIVGENFRFGQGAAGTVGTLADLGHQFSFEVESVGLHYQDGIAISSTEIRRRVVDGDVEFAASALGRPFVFDALVVRGDGRGRTIGIPTVNLEAQSSLIVPAHGIYAGRLSAGKVTYNAAISIGDRPTFDGEGVTVEAHLLDTEVDLYGHDVALTFEHRLRDELKFADADALVKQIQNDIELTRKLLAVDERARRRTTDSQGTSQGK